MSLVGYLLTRYIKRSRSTVYEPSIAIASQQLDLVGLSNNLIMGFLPQGRYSAVRSQLRAVVGCLVRVGTTFPRGGQGFTIIKY